MESIVACNVCKCRLAMQYVKYRDTEQNPYCMICYTRLVQMHAVENIQKV